MIITTEKYCTGCGTCFLSCPVKCINLFENDLGELIPNIDEDKCINCNKCSSICPQNNPPTYKDSMECYVAWSKNEYDLIYSASGGVGAVFMRWQLKNSGIVYGCDFDENAVLKHFELLNEDDINKARSSKYVRSNAYCVYERIKDQLEQLKFVLFIGTPCQIAALINYLHKPYENLITVDLICHGTPPNKYLIEYLKKFKYKPTRIRFRGQYDQQLTLWNNELVFYRKNNKKDLYFDAFYKNMISYNSCYECQYAQSKRISDITIGDFWGLGNLKEISQISKRPSVILVNTLKGKDFFAHVVDDLIYEKREVNEAIQGNGRLNNPPGESFEAKCFQKLYFSFPFSFSVRTTNIISHIHSVFAVLKMKYSKKTLKKIYKNIKRKIKGYFR